MKGTFVRAFRWKHGCIDSNARALRSSVQGDVDGRVRRVCASRSLVERDRVVPISQEQNGKPPLFKFMPQQSAKSQRDIFLSQRVSERRAPFTPSVSRVNH